MAGAQSQSEVPGGTQIWRGRGHCWRSCALSPGATSKTVPPLLLRHKSNPGKQTSKNHLPRESTSFYVKPLTLTWIIPFLHRCNSAAAEFSFCARQTGYYVPSYLGPSGIRLLNICYTFPWQQEWGNLESCHLQSQRAFLFFFLLLLFPCCIPALFSTESHAVRQRFHAKSILVGDCPDAALSPSDEATARERTGWNNSDINAASDHACWAQVDLF